VVEVVEVLLVVLDSGKDGVVRSESEKILFIVSSNFGIFNTREG